MNNIYDMKGHSHFAMISPLAIIGKNNYIGPFSIIGDNVIIGDNNYIGPGCIIGEPPESRRFLEESTAMVVIGNGNKFMKQVTIDGGTGGKTLIGNDNLFLKNAHIGHDVDINNEVTLACNAVVGGHVVINSNANIGLQSVINPRCVIPYKCRIGANSLVTRKSILESEKTYAGSPVRLLNATV